MPPYAGTHDLPVEFSLQLPTYAHQLLSFPLRRLFVRQRIQSLQSYSQSYVRYTLCRRLTSMLRLTFLISSFSSAESSRCRSIGPLQSLSRGSWYVCRSARRRRMEVVICCASEDMVGML